MCTDEGFELVKYFIKYLKKYKELDVVNSIWFDLRSIKNTIICVKNWQ